MVAFVVLLGGCSTLAEISKGRQDYKAGWRKGIVAKVADASALGSPEHRTKDCRASEPAAFPQRPYALIEYNRRSSRRSRIVSIPDGMVVAAGDLVRVNVKRCDGAIRPRDDR